GQQVGASTAAVSTAQANLTAAIVKRDNQSDQTKRILQLVEKGVDTKTQGDQASAALAVAEAAVTAADSELRRAQEQLGPEGENAQMQLALQDLEAAQLNLSRAKVVAPSEGV